MKENVHYAGVLSTIGSPSALPFRGAEKACSRALLSSGAVHPVYNGATPSHQRSFLFIRHEKPQAESADQLEIQTYGRVIN
jgi:hypothetical protein